MSVLHKEYRPQTWDEVIGQPAVVKSLRAIMEKKRTQCVLLSGPSGTGKTTLARIAARAFGCDDQTIRDINAAMNTGIDDMRAVQEALRFVPFGKSKALALVIDEAHRLSAQAWDSLLKATEEPPAHVIWFFCTTNAAKMPKTMQTRCAKFDLKPINDDAMMALLDKVCDAEKMDPSADIAEMIIEKAQGSARDMLQYLAVAGNAANRKEAAALLATAIDSKEGIDLCRLLADRNAPSWTKVMALTAKLEKENVEGIRILAMNYFGSCLKGAKTNNEATFWLNRLEAFATPYNSAEGFAPLYLSIGRVLFQ